MAYRRRRSSRYSRSRYARPTRRRRSTRRRTSRRSSPQRIVIQVIGGAGGMVPISATPGTKGKRVLRARY